MYHDEFATKPTRPIPAARVAPSTLPMEVGGGLSLGLVASLNQPLSIVLFYLGGLLPLVACSLEIAARRAGEFLVGLAPRREAVRPPAVPASHLRTAPARSAGPHRRPATAGIGRAGIPGLRRPTP